VEGRVFTNEALDSAAEKRHYTLDETQRKIYTTIGGTPHLDKNYTVFGEVEYGLDVIDKIAFVPTSKTDRPMGDVRMNIYLFNKKGKILKKKLKKIA
jgi:peptidyl-prolyl cis-trans isomerase B (cyclophilin B)